MRPGRGHVSGQNRRDGASAGALPGSEASVHAHPVILGAAQAGATVTSLSNFGRNIRFTPRSRYEPRSEEEVLRILDEHRDGTVRAIGAGHSWNPGIESHDALVDLNHLQRIRVHRDRTRVTAGARGQDRRSSQAPLQTGSHAAVDRAHRPPDGGGSDRHGHPRLGSALDVALRRVVADCLLRCGRWPQESGQWTRDGALRAARCAVGAMGIVLEVTLPCVPQYYVREKSVWRFDLDAALAAESGRPAPATVPDPALLEIARARKVRRSAESAEGIGACVPCVLVHGDRRAAAPRAQAFGVLAPESSADSPAVSADPAGVPCAGVARDRTGATVSYSCATTSSAIWRWRSSCGGARLGEALEFVEEVLQAADDGSREVSATTRGRMERLGLSAAFEELRGSVRAPLSDLRASRPARRHPDLDVVVPWNRGRGLVRDQSHHFRGAAGAIPAGCAGCWLR